jgi:hypothetical protein
MRYRHVAVPFDNSYLNQDSDSAGTDHHHHAVSLHKVDNLESQRVKGILAVSA